MGYMYGVRLLLAVLAASGPRCASCSGFNVVGNLAFFALSDWGGQTSAPYTTPGQLAAAASLGRLADQVRPKLVLSAGGNFLDQGLPGAWRLQRRGVRGCGVVCLGPPPGGPKEGLQRPHTRATRAAATALCPAARLKRCLCV
jgi:hypothetical protein